MILPAQLTRRKIYRNKTILGIVGIKIVTVLFAAKKNFFTKNYFLLAKRPSF